MFSKVGTPQPIKVASELCQECRTKIATTCVNGRMVCDECKEKINFKKED